MKEDDAQKIYVAMYAPTDITVILTESGRPQEHWDFKKVLNYNCINCDLTQHFYYSTDFSGAWSHLRRSQVKQVNKIIIINC